METLPCACGETTMEYNPETHIWENACWTCLYLYNPTDDYNPEEGNLNPSDWFPKQNDELPF